MVINAFVLKIYSRNIYVTRNYQLAIHIHARYLLKLRRPIHVAACIYRRGLGGGNFGVYTPAHAATRGTSTERARY